MKWLIVTLIIILAFLVTIIYIPLTSNNNSHQELNKYYGPVPEGYDQEHFWRTGEMRLIKNGFATR